MTISDFIDIDQTHQVWVRANYLIVHLPSMENGFLDSARHRKEIWDYIQYRESLVKWPTLNKKRTPQ
jgi:hypothetical protein